jgi:hypothetical protein
LPFEVFDNEPRVVTDETVEQLKKRGASKDLIEAAERARDTNPLENGSAPTERDDEGTKST